MVSITIRILKLHAVHAVQYCEEIGVILCEKMLVEMYANSFENKPNLGGPAAEGVGLLQHDFWVYGFESR